MGGVVILDCLEPQASVLCDAKVSVISASQGVVSANKSYPWSNKQHLRDAHRFLVIVRCFGSRIS